MRAPLRILHLEDDPGDAELVEAALSEAGIESAIRVVATRKDFTNALENGGIDLVLADLALPAFDGMTALAIVRERAPDLPFIFVSGRLGEEAAIESLKSGATDYVLKNRLSRLVPAVKRALSESEERAERRKAEEELERANSEIRETAERYQNLFTSIRDVIVVTDHDRTILHVNQPAMRDIFGYEPEEVEGKSIRILYADEEGFRLSGRGIVDLSDLVKGKILEVNFRRKNGELFIGEQYVMKRLDSEGTPTGNISIFRDISERKKAEEALRESEMRRYQLQMELVYAAEVQAKLLPRNYPRIPGFDVAARCLPAKQVGGDFFDWMEVCRGVWSFTLGDVMGKGMAAAMLMATVRASLRSVAHHRPGEALRLAEQALFDDFENSESFVTLFHAQLYGEARMLTFVDCGHGYVFLRHGNGAVEELSPRWLPLGVPGPKMYQEGKVELEKGDILVIYSDGLTDARPELCLTNSILASHLNGSASAHELVERLITLTEQKGPQPDDITVLVMSCTG
ncbi:MAG TPA: SpoIIE family protein phosphatase [Geobacteraceae bacterium]|nr:SpoIIE family protein phosphatase [Geobacteraceae bacterium]